MASLNPHTLTRFTKSSSWLNITAKNAVLKSPELMAITFSHLPITCSLLNAALTCKDFLDIGLDALWEELDSLMPLMKLLPNLQFEDLDYNRSTSTYVLGENVSQAGWDRLQYYSRKVRSFTFGDSDDDIHVHSSTYIRIAQLLQSTSLFPSLRHLKFDSYNYDMDTIFLFLSPVLESLELTNIRYNEHIIVGPFLARLSSQMLRRIVLHNGEISANFLKKYIARFKQLRSLELSDGDFLSDFTAWEVLGTLPSLANLTMKATKPAPASHWQTRSHGGGPKYFDALESLSVTGSFLLIQHLLDFIDSPCLTTIKFYPTSVLNEHEFEHEADDFTPSMTIITFKWSQSLKNLVIVTDDVTDDSSTGSMFNTAQRRRCYAISKCLKLLTVLQKMRTFHLTWKMENMEDDVRLLVKSWPKLRSLKLHLDSTVAFISFATLRIIAENCPELRYLQIPLNDDTSTIPFFDTSIKNLHHNLEVLDLRIVDSDRAQPSTITPTSRRQWLECHIQVAKYLDFIFPYLTDIELTPYNETWSGIRDLIMLCQDARRAKYEAM